ncbi:MAG: hypothetical protein QXQ46_08985 [Thermoplasmatales archaeon]
MRIMGSLAVFIRVSNCPECIQTYKSLGRFGEGKPLFTDLDIVAYSKQAKKVNDFLVRNLRFQPNIYVNTLYSNTRGIYYHPDGKYSVDVFYDRLSFSHDVEFAEGNRLDNAGYTIELEDIVLEKLQIHEINRKDLIDLFILFLAYKVSDKKEDGIDGSYIARVLADDWGFWFDATNNLKKISEFIKKEQKVEKKHLEQVEVRISKLQELIEKEPKTKRWEKRSKKGTSKPWYNEVEEVER